MPDGVVQLLDASSGEIAVVRGGHVFRTRLVDVASDARHLGARVHFDIDPSGGRALHVALYHWAPPWSHRPRSRVPAPPATEAAGPAPVETVIRGDVSPDAVRRAKAKVAAVAGSLGEPILFTRLKLIQTADGPRARPAMAQVTLDVNGELVRAHVAAPTMLGAIDQLEQRLRDQLSHRAERFKARRQDAASPDSGEWRHADRPTPRPEYLDRPVDERVIVRHKTFSTDELTPDEAAFDLSQLDYDFYLFRDLASGMDALMERRADGSYRLTFAGEPGVEPVQTAVSAEVASAPAPALTLAEAVERLDAGGEAFVFFAEAGTGRGQVVYRRYDGHYGLISSE